MDKAQRISEINQKLDTFIYTDGFFVFLGIILLIVIAAVIIIAGRTEYSNSPFAIFTVLVLCFLFFLVICSAIIYEKSQLESELVELATQET